MSRAPHLLLGISAHGFGHLAQVAPVIEVLRLRVPGLRLSVASTLPAGVLRRRLAMDFEHLPVETDPVIPMRSAWEVDVPAACRAYRNFHAEHERRLAELVGTLRRLAPDLVLADIPWLLLTAAARVDIPAVALCSLNWAEVFASYCEEGPGADDLLDAMWAGYRAAAVFLRPVPALPMRELANTRAIGPIARTGRADRTALHARLGLPDEVRTVLVALGGIPTALPLARWPQVADTVWLFPDGVSSGRADLVDGSRLELPFIDLLASSDAVLTKPGYGTCAEAVCNGVPLLMLERPDWPETAGMLAWARRHGRLEVVRQADFLAGDFAAALATPRERPVAAPPRPAGAETAAGVVAGMLK